MPCLVGRYTPQLGLITNMGVTPGGLAGSNPGARNPTTLFPALIDTGASHTCISPQVTQSLGLRPTGLRLMTSATGVDPVNVFLVDLIFPFGDVGFIRPGAQALEFAALPGNARSAFEPGRLLRAARGVSRAVRVGAGPREGALVHDEVLGADRPAGKPALQDFPGSRRVAGLCRE